MNPSIFLTLLCVGIASAAPNPDHSLSQQANQWMAEPGSIFDTITGILKNIVTSTIDSVVKKYLLGGRQKEKSSMTALNAPTDMTNEEFQVEGELTLEPEAQNEERTLTEIPSSVDFIEEDYVTPAMRK